MFGFISTGEDWPVAIQICSFSRKDCTVWYIMLWRSFYIFLLNSTFWFCSYLLKKKLHLYSSNLIRRNTWYAIWIDLNNYTISLSNIYIELGEIPLKCVNSTSERLKYSTLGTINCKKTFTSIQEHSGASNKKVSKKYNINANTKIWKTVFEAVSASNGKMFDCLLPFRIRVTLFYKKSKAKTGNVIFPFLGP